MWRPRGEASGAHLVVLDVGVLPGLGQQAVVPEDGAVVEPTLTHRETRQGRQWIEAPIQTARRRRFSLSVVWMGQADGKGKPTRR